MTDRFESILDESISALQAGVPIDEILAETPEYATELRPLLYAALLLADPRPELMPEERKAALRAEYMSRAAALPPIHPGFRDKVQAVLHVIKKRLTPGGVLSDLTTITVTVILTLLMALLLLSFAARDAIPGDFLYGMKLISETVQSSMALTDERRAALEAEFNQRRLVELEQLINLNRTAAVQFQGILEVKGENLWIIQGQHVLLPVDIILTGNPQEGDRVAVTGLLRRNNVLVADTISKVE